MMLKSEQQRLYALMPDEIRCFVRVCEDDRSLWVSDLPRRYSEWKRFIPKLESEGFSGETDETAGLLYVDLSPEKWKEWLKTLPAALPLLPAEEQYHRLYALCRLLMRHPAELEAQHMPVIRSAVKLTAYPAQKILRTVETLHEETAVRLREGKTLPYFAGCVLAAWLDGQINGKERQI